MRAFGFVSQDRDSSLTVDLFKKRKTTTKNVARKLHDYQEMLSNEAVLSRVCKASKQIHYFKKQNFLFVFLTAH